MLTMGLLRDAITSSKCSDLHITLNHKGHMHIIPNNRQSPDTNTCQLPRRQLHLKYN